MRIPAILFILLLTSNAFADNYSFTKVNGDMGLSHNNTKSILQDSYGFMWFGTRNRLNRYDGISCKIFDCYDRNTCKGNNNIGVIFECPDKKLWLGTDKGIFIFDPVLETFSSFEAKTANNESIEEWVADIQQDNNNNIWIVVPNQGVFKYNLDSNVLRMYTVVEDLTPSISNPQCIAIEKNGRVWIGSNGSGIFLYNSSSDSFTQYLGNGNSKYSLDGKNIYTICHDNEYIIIGIHEEQLLKFDKKRNILLDMNYPQISNRIIRQISIVNDREIWVATQQGLFIINEDQQSVDHIKEDVLNKYTLSDNFIECIYQDREGGVWLGTNFGGVNYLRNHNDKFEKYFPVSEPYSINSYRIREMAEDKNGHIWIGTEDAGVSVFDPATQRFRTIGNSYFQQALALLVRDTEVWVGYFKNGMDIMQSANNTVRHYSAEELGLNEESVLALCEDRYGNIWLGNAWGVFVASGNSTKFKRMDKFGLSFIFDIIEDTEGYIWIATIGNGVFQYDNNTGELVHHVAGGENSLSSNSVSSITEDHLGQIWFSTDRGGICVYNKDNKSFKRYSMKEGLPDDIAYKILEDRNHNLWFGTNRGLVMFNPSTEYVRVFTQNEGLLSNQFNYKSGLISSSGKLYFGCMDGLIAFRPEEFKENQFIPPVYITKLSVFNKEIVPDAENSLLKKSILHTDAIELPYNQTNITLEFVALSYTAPFANKYCYRMDGIDADWIYSQNMHSASYSNLPPGKYIFRVKGSNNDGLWNENEETLEIIVLPPWWSSNMAYLLYFATICIILYFTLRFSLKRYKRRNEEQQKLFEVEKERELYEAKVDFFTDIAHEIRTPITLINGPLEDIIEMDLPDEKLKQNLSYIKQNTNNLLDLVNQLLDFRKVDSNKFLLSFRNINITELLSEIIDKFKPQALSLNKKLNLQIRNTDEEEIFAYVDKDGFCKIIYNLLSNALKYAKDDIDVRLISDNTYFTIEVSNNGELIPKEYQEKIFEPFFQIKALQKETTGSGIGLSLSRSLAGLHNGYLFYTSTSDLNNFILKIPVSLHIYEEHDKNPESTGFIIKQNDVVNLKRYSEAILVVEDNSDMLNFIGEKLNGKYRVIKALNGLEAYKILQTENIDIVITDIMMPGKDGLELCELIKSDIELNHIIVILLTAKNDMNTKIKGLEAGADAYVEKPFSFQYLQALLSSLINNRIREMELLRKKPFISTNQLGMNKADEQFLNKLIAIINDHMEDSNFNVEILAESVYLSRSSLHRKLKAIINTAPTDFIRQIRLQRAAELIQEGKYRINEICYLVGINSPSYFIKVFQNHYGMTPKDFEKQYKNK